MEVLDLSKLSRDGLDQKLHDMEVSARQRLGGEVEPHYRRTSDRHFEVEFVRAAIPPSEPLVLTSTPLDTNSLQGLGQFDRRLAQAVIETNKENLMSNVTGASLLGDQFRSNLAAIKDKVNKAGQKMSDALKDLDATAAQASQMADQVTAETADLKAAMGLHSNGGPI